MEHRCIFKKISEKGVFLLNNLFRENMYFNPFPGRDGTEWTKMDWSGNVKTPAYLLYRSIFRNLSKIKEIV